MAVHLDSKIWALPDATVKYYHSRQNVKLMFPWQAQCLQTGKALDGGNLIFSAPTSAGKTLVAEILLMRRLMKYRKKVLFILPFVSVVSEKTVALRSLLDTVNFKVGGFMGSHTPPGGFDAVDVAICTIERANSMVNRLMKAKDMDQLCMVIIDELHMVGDTNRGCLIEPLLTKILYQSKSQWPSSASIQIVGMSATLPNLDILANWLNADLYCTRFRPVPLKEYVKAGTIIYDHQKQYVREIECYMPHKEDDEHIVDLCLETLCQGRSVLIFCPTKLWCEKLSLLLARLLYELKTNVHRDFDLQKAITTAINEEKLLNVVELLTRSPAGVNKQLKLAISYMCAYHHSGLTMEEKTIVESAFRSGTVRILCATTTLSSGVNLPAQRVIIRSPLMGGQLIDALTYKQMSGRAGRQGIDTTGESFIVCKPAEMAKVVQMMTSNLPPATSCLAVGNASEIHSSWLTRKAVLEVIASRYVQSIADVERYFSCTLLASELQYGPEKLQCLVQECVQYLTANEFLQSVSPLDPYSPSIEVWPTQLGSAVFSSSMNPEESLIILTDLNKARRSFVLENDLHMVYQVTPPASGSSVDWNIFLKVWHELPSDLHRTGETIGISEKLLVMSAQGRGITKAGHSVNDMLRTHRRFYIALALYDLIHEMSLSEVSIKYGIPHGTLQAIQQQASVYAGMICTFCESLQWTPLQLLLADLPQRLDVGVRRELVDLSRVTSLDAKHARQIFNHGVCSVAQLAQAEQADIAVQLIRASPFETIKQASDWETREKQAKQILISGRNELTPNEAAAVIIKEAKLIFQIDLQKLSIKFKADSKGGTNAKMLQERLLRLCLTNGTSHHQLQHKVTAQIALPEGTELSSGQMKESIQTEPRENTSDSPLIITGTANIMVDSATGSVTPSAEQHPMNMSLTGDELANVDNSLSVSVMTWDEMESVLEMTDESLAASESDDLFSDASREDENSCDEELAAGNQFSSQDNAQSSSHAASASRSYLSVHSPSSMGGHGKNCVAMVDLNCDKSLLQMFLQECQNVERLSLALASRTVTVTENRSEGQANESPILAGAAICIGAYTSFYLDVMSNFGSSKVSLESRQRALKNILSLRKPKACYQFKQQVCHTIDIDSLSHTHWDDPSVADWLLLPSATIVPLPALVNKYNNGVDLLTKATSMTQFITQNISSEQGHIRTAACCEAVITFHIMSSLTTALQERQNLWNFYNNIEIPHLVCLTHLDSQGMGFDKDIFAGEKLKVFELMEALEDAVYRYSALCLTDASNMDIKQMLYVNLGLPLPSMSKDETRRKPMNKKSAWKIDKITLQHLSAVHPVPGYIIEWRKLRAIYNNSILPLERLKKWCSSQQMYKIHPTSDIHTATGRVTFREPNLQNLPKNFMQVYPEQGGKCKPAVEISLRSAFIPSPGSVLVSCDYSQLELRIMAHLAKDKHLLDLLNGGGDVFKQIASSLAGTSEESVTKEERQSAKQMCYAVLYGMGMKSLAEQLGIADTDAYKLICKFDETCTGLRDYSQKVVERCRVDGFISTVSGRRRYLPAIESSNPVMRSKAERQAINSTVQGSAADIVKCATVKIQQCLGCSPIMQVHDELIFDVEVKQMDDYISGIVNGMQSVASYFDMKVKLPVRVSIGRSWGSLCELSTSQLQSFNQSLLLA